MDVRVAHPRDSPCHEIPDGDTTVVASHRKHSAPAIEGARESLAAGIKNSIVVLLWVQRYST